MTLLTTAFAQGTHAARPAAASSNNGFYYYETDTGRLFQSTGAAWQQVAASTATDVLTTKGDVLGFSTAPARVPIGADGQVLTADSTQALGLKWAAAGGGGGGNFTLIQDITLAVDTATIDFTAIAGTYKHLRVIGQLRGTLAAVNDNTQLRMNNDSAANYDDQALQGSNTGTSAPVGTGQTQIRIAGLPCANASANSFNNIDVSLACYAGANFKTAVANSGYVGTTGTSSTYVTQQWFGLWRSTAAITRLTFAVAGGGNLKAGSQLTLYGLN